MFRRIMAISVLGSLVTLSACNDATGPVRGGSSRPHPAPKPPEVFDKVCLSDVRAVTITHPIDGQRMLLTDFTSILWEAREICGHYTAEVSYSIDGGNQFAQMGPRMRDALSMSWYPGTMASQLGTGRG